MTTMANIGHCDGKGGEVGYVGHGLARWINWKSDQLKKSDLLNSWDLQGLLPKFSLLAEF